MPFVQSRSGEQFVIATNGMSATITETGATLRSFVHANEQIVWGFGEDELSGGGRGQVLAPWPNRLQDGTYRFDGVEAIAAIDEPSTRCALHGLVRWLSWQAISQSSSRVSLRCPIAPQPGYPFCLSLELDYELVDDGLQVTTRARNVDDRRIPFAIGFHPYLLGSEGSIDHALLSLPAGKRLRLDTLGLPYANQTEPTNEALSSSGGLHLSGQRFDDCFTALDTEHDRWRAKFFPSSDQRPVILWADAAFRYLMCFTGDTLAPNDRRRAVAIEPMTSPPNALHSGKDLIVLEPGEEFSASWGIAVSN